METPVVCPVIDRHEERPTDAEFVFRVSGIYTEKGWFSSLAAARAAYAVGDSSGSGNGIS